MVALNKTTFTALAAAGQLFNLVDFESHFLDLAFATTIDGNTVISQVPNVPPTSNQQWLLNILPSGTIQIQNALGPFVSFCTASSGGELDFAPAVVSSEFPLAFNINFVDGGAMFTEVSTGLALTAWQSVNNISTVSPITYAPLVAGAKEQIWDLSILS